MDIRLTTDPEIPREPALKARELLRRLQRQTRRPLIAARLTLRQDSPNSGSPFLADASVVSAGRLLAAHASGRSPLQAADTAVARLGRQLQDLVAAEVAQRNEPLRRREPARDGRARMKPPTERQIVPRRPYVSTPLPTLDAIDDLLALEVRFNLFRHARSLEDVVVHRRDDGGIGLLHPRGSVLADEGDLVVPEPSRYSEALKLRDARVEMDFLNHRYLYFTDARDSWGKVLYLRADGDYGLVEPD